jgi:hypothetical protein
MLHVVVKPLVFMLSVLLLCYNLQSVLKLWHWGFLHGVPFTWCSIRWGMALPSLNSCFSIVQVSPLLLLGRRLMSLWSLL